MKRYGALYEKIYSMENIILAHKNAKKGKSKYKEVIKVEENLEFYLSKIHFMLKNKTFVNSKYHIFKRVFHNKEREIFKLPYFPDRIIHHCIVQVLGPIWEKTFIKHTYSSIKHRGIHQCLKHVKQALEDKENSKYCLKMDVRKFYPSIDHAILKIIIRKKIKCKDTLEILDTIIDSTNGVPIGNYLSQFFGNLYLTYFDHWMKEEKHCKNYFRYCDDIVILHESKEFLHSLRHEVQYYLNTELNLSLKSNWQVFPIESRGLDFVGYKSFNNYSLLRKSIKVAFKHIVLKIRNRKYVNYQKIVEGLTSYFGWIKHCNGKTLKLGVI
jgi:hypothetical protein